MGSGGICLHRPVEAKRVDYFDPCAVTVGMGSSPPPPRKLGMERIAGASHQRSTTDPSSGSPLRGEGTGSNHLRGSTGGGPVAGRRILSAAGRLILRRNLGAGPSTHGPSYALPRGGQRTGQGLELSNAAYFRSLYGGPLPYPLVLRPRPPLRPGTNSVTLFAFSGALVG
jgi:hypothetical protein